MKIVYLGIDVGSSSLKFALMDKEEQLVDSLYLKNHGLINTVKQGLKQILNENYDVRGVGITGSGRKFLGMLIGADKICSEILAHATSCLKYCPDAKTIIDIGAEDNKAILFNDGYIENFIMNSMCAGGCGQTLEMIANRLGVQIEDVGELACKSKNKLNISSKCGIFMNSMVVSHRNLGQSNEDILMGVIRGITNNYLQMIQGMDLQPPYVFQSASAKNKAFVKSFEESFNHKVIIHPYCDVAGAIGMALIILRDPPKQTNFKGFEIANRNYRTKTRICQDCENHCELNELYDDLKLIGTMGSRCGKY